MFRRRRVVEAAQAAAPSPDPDPDPAAAEQGEDANAPSPGVLTGDSLWAPGTRRGLGTRLVQALIAAAAIAFMASTDGYNKFTAFRHLTAAMTLQCIWCLSLVAVDVSALLINQSFRTLVAACIGDLVTGTLTFIAASGSAAIIVVIHDTGVWSENQYRSFTAATAMAFLSWFAIALPCIFNLWAAIYQIQESHGSMESERCIKECTLLWLWRRERNKANACELRRNVATVAHSVEVHSQEFQECHRKKKIRNLSSTEQRKWTPPPTTALKINIDAALKEGCPMVAGVS